jgi:hypothetical protein
MDEANTRICECPEPSINSQLCSCFAPLTWIHFGGERGQKLRQLRSIEVKLDHGNLVQLSFHYLNDDDQSRYVEEFGFQPQHDEISDIIDRQILRVAARIDGHGGEVVTGIKVFTQSRIEPDKSEDWDYDMERCHSTIQV